MISRMPQNLSKIRMRKNKDKQKLKETLESVVNGMEIGKQKKG